jgi:aminodeoxyfutalosine synthase
MTTIESAIEKIVAGEKDPALKNIGEKIINQKRMTEADGLTLFEKGNLPFVGALANHVRERLHGNKTYFNRNFHIEPTNVCVFSCSFCSYSRLYAHRDEGWELSQQQMLDIVKKYDDKPVTEVHIVGGVHPKMNMEFFMELMRKIKAHRPTLHIKGFTAVELDYMFRKAKLSVEEGMKKCMRPGLIRYPVVARKFFIRRYGNKYPLIKLMPTDGCKFIASLTRWECIAMQLCYTGI